jgi:hypothetical protein
MERKGKEKEKELNGEKKEIRIVFQLFLFVLFVSLPFLSRTIINSSHIIFFIFIFLIKRSRRFTHGCTTLTMLIITIIRIRRLKVQECRGVSPSIDGTSLQQTRGIKILRLSEIEIR